MTPMSRRVMFLVRFLEMLGVLMRFDFSVLMQGCRDAELHVSVPQRFFH
jgi:hypothetical protein